MNDTTEYDLNVAARRITELEGMLAAQEKLISVLSSSTTNQRIAELEDVIRSARHVLAHSFSPSGYRVDDLIRRMERALTPESLSSHE